MSLGGLTKLLGNRYVIMTYAIARTGILYRSCVIRESNHSWDLGIWDSLPSFTRRHSATTVSLHRFRFHRSFLPKEAHFFSCFGSNTLTKAVSKKSE